MEKSSFKTNFDFVMNDRKVRQMISQFYFFRKIMEKRNNMMI